MFSIESLRCGFGFNLDISISDIFRYIQIYSDIFRYIQIYSDIFRYIQISYKYPHFRTFLKLHGFTKHQQGTSAGEVYASGWCHPGRSGGTEDSKSIFNGLV